MASPCRFIEIYLPYVVAVPVCVLGWQFPPLIPSEYHEDVIGSSLTLDAIFLGFMSTSLSILISYKETRVASELRSSGAMKLLVSYLRQAILWTLLWMITSFVLYFQQPRLLPVVWSVFAVLALLCFLRVVHLLSKLIL